MNQGIKNTAGHQSWSIVLWFALLLFVLPANALCQQQQNVFESLTVLDGLSQNLVNAIIQDSDGLMWFGTLDGVNIYDGYSFTTYSNVPGDPNSLTDNQVRSMYSDNHGDIWIGTSLGLNRITHETRSVTRFTRVQGDTTTLSNRHIRVMCEDTGGVLWIGTSWGLNRFNPASETFTHYVRDLESPFSADRNRVRVLCPDTAGSLWVGTEHGLCFFDTVRGTFTEYLPDSSDSEFSSALKVIGINHYSRDELLVSFEHGGVLLFNTAIRQFQPYPLYEQNRALFEGVLLTCAYRDTKGVAWFGSMDGLIRLDSRGGWGRRYRSDVAVPYAIHSSNITSICEDRSGILWFGTTGGVAKFNPVWERFTHYTHDPRSAISLSGTDARAVCEDHAGNLWIGTERGLNRIDRATSTATLFNDPGAPGLATSYISLLFRDRVGNLWAGTHYTRQNVLTCIGPDGRVVVSYDYIPGDSTGINGGNIASICEDREGYLWIGTNGGGMSRYDPRDRTFHAYTTDWIRDTGISGNWVSSIHEDREGYLWIGTDNGLNRMSPDRHDIVSYANRIENPRSLSNDRVRAICEDSRGRIWIGTENGLNRYDPLSDDFTVYNDPSGITGNMIFFIYEDRSGNLWMSTSKGISMFNPVSGRFRNIDHHHGLRDVDFMYGTGYWSDNTQRMYFGGGNGLIEFDPGDITENLYVPPIVITSFRAIAREGLPLSIEYPHNDIQLQYRTNFFTIEFAALDYTVPGENTYSYMLTGVDDEWVFNQATRRVSYTNVPPGDYLFRVRGANNDGIWNTRGATLSIRVVPPLWMTVWFRAIIALSLVALLLVWYRLHFQRLDKQRVLLNDKVRERTHALEEKNQALYESEQRFRRMFTQSATGIILTDAEGWLVDINEAGRRIFGTAANTTRAYPNIFLDPHIPKKTIETLMRGIPVSFEMTYDFEDERVRQIFSTEHNGIHTLNVVGTPLGLTEEGAPAQYLFQITDTTDQKLLEEQLLIRERMDFLGNLSAGIAHDFNNLLVGIIGNLDLMRLDGDHLSSDQTEYLEDALGACKRAAGLIQDFQSLSSGPIAERGDVDLYQIVKDVFGILERTTDRLIEKHIEFEPETFIVDARPDQLHQVFMNLGMNAAAAIEEKGIVPGDAITVKADMLDTVPFEGGDRHDRYVRVTVRDTGAGMTDDVKRRAFDPLFTTKARGVHKGQGLGLAMAYTIVTRNHDGFIEIESAPGRGAAVHIYLPGGGTIQKEPTHTEEILPTGTETVLIVEDEAAVRDVTKTFLEAYGYTVITAQDGKDGLDRYTQSWQDIDLVLLDLTMPRLSGEVVFSRMFEINPEVRIIISSGHGSDVLAQFDRAAASLGKPYRMSDLARIVRTALDS